MSDEELLDQGQKTAYDSVRVVHRAMREDPQGALPELEQQVPSQAVVEFAAKIAGLPEGSKRVFKNENSRSYSCDAYHIEQLLKLATKTKEQTVDLVTGLETNEAMVHGLAADIQEWYEFATSLTNERVPLSQAILEVRGHMTAEYTDHFDVTLARTHHELSARSFTSESEKQAVTEAVTRRVLRREMLLSYMSTQAVSFVDTRGMAAVNTWNETHQRKDMGPQQTTDETGLKKAGRTKQALSVYLGGSEYQDSLYAYEGDQVKIWEDEDAVEIVDAIYYLTRVVSLCDRHDLMYAQAQKLSYTGYRIRVGAGDEGIARISKASFDEQGRLKSLTQEDLQVMERLQAMASYVVAGEYSEQESQVVLGKFNYAFGEYSKLTEFQGKLPVILVDRVGSVRLDHAFSNTAAYHSEEDSLAQIIADTVSQVSTDAENKMGQNKLVEQMVLLQNALNGDILVQLELAAMDKRFPVNPAALAEILRSDFAGKSEFTWEDIVEIFKKTKLRQSDEKPQ